MGVTYNPNYEFLHKHFKRNDIRSIVLEGGSRSGKTYSVLSFFIWLCKEYPNAGIEFAIVRKTLAAIKPTALKDFIGILKAWGLYDESSHDKTNHTYKLFGNILSFFGADNDMKLRGFSCDVLYCNEALELDAAEWLQLKLRTRRKIIIDYNPSEADHFFYDELDPDEQSVLLRTTFRDNPFLSDLQKRDIAGLESKDEGLFKIYGKGERGTIEGVIFQNWRLVEKMPISMKNYGCGLDFGFTNDPTALVECGVHNGEIWLNEILYERGYSNVEIYNHFKASGVNKALLVIADSAEPKSISQLRTLGMNVNGATKGADSVRHSINLLKQYKINVTGSSVNLIKELKSYKWRQSGDRVLNEPIDNMNHAIDAVRYWAMSNFSAGKRGFNFA